MNWHESRNPGWTQRNFRQQLSLKRSVGRASSILCRRSGYVAAKARAASAPRQRDGDGSSEPRPTKLSHSQSSGAVDKSKANDRIERVSNEH